MTNLGLFAANFGAYLILFLVFAGCGVASAFAGIALRKKKNAGRKPNNAQWQASYNAFVALYEQGLPMVEIVERSECSRRTCYRYKSYYDNLMKMKDQEA